MLVLLLLLLLLLLLFFFLQAESSLFPSREARDWVFVKKDLTDSRAKLVSGKDIHRGDAADSHSMQIIGSLFSCSLSISIWGLMS